MSVGRPRSVFPPLASDFAGKVVGPGWGTHLRLSAALTLVFFLARFLVTFLPLFALVCAADAMVRLSAADFFARSRSLRDFVM